MHLRVLPSTAADVPPLDGPGVEVWRDASGTLCAVGYRRPPDHRLFVPNIGTFVFATGPGAAAIAVEPLPDAVEDLVDDAFHRIAMPLAVQSWGAGVLHASAVLTSGGVVALCGPAGQGKSTLAFALSRHGHQLYADDAVAFTLPQDAVKVAPLPFRMRLRPASADWFEAPALLKGRERSTGWSSGEAARFRSLFVLDRQEDAPPGTVEVERLDPVAAFPAVLPHAYYLALDDGAENGRLVAQYLELVERVPVFVLRYHPVLESLESIVAAIDAAVSPL